MRIRVGPIRIGGGRRPSLTMGLGPIGVTIGGRRKKRWKPSHGLIDSNMSHLEVTQEQLEWRHARSVHQEILDESSRMCSKVTDFSDNPDWPFLHVLFQRSLVILGFSALVLLTTRDVEHVLALYLIYSSMILIALSPAAMLFQRTLHGDESESLFDGVPEAVQIGRTNFTATYIPIWLLILGAFLIESATTLDEELSDIISLKEITVFVIIYVLIVVMGVVISTKVRTKSNAAVLEELRLITLNHLFISVPKKSMLRYESICLAERYLKVVKELSLRKSHTDVVYAKFYDPDSFDEKIRLVSQMKIDFERIKNETSHGKKLLVLSDTCYRLPEHSARLMQNRSDLRHFQSTETFKRMNGTWESPEN
jgi:hypothetical protein